MQSSPVAEGVPTARCTHEFDRSLRELGSRQHGLAHRGQLLLIGVSSHTVDRWIARGRLRPVMRGVVSIGHDAPSPYARTLAPVLALGNGTHASHWSAAWLHGLIEAAPRVTHVTTSGRGASRPGVVVHHATSADTTAVCGVPVSVLPRTLLDLASLVPAARIANMLHELQFHEQLDALTLQSLRSVHHGHRGAATLTDALRMWDLGSAGAPSRFQLDVWEWVLSWAPMEPTLDDQVKTRIGMIRPDIHWRPQLVVVEADGRSVHDRERTRRRDQVRTQALGELGYVVIRIEPDDFRWRRHLKRLEIEQALGRGRE